MSAPLPLSSLLWQRRVEFPFDPALSKNKIVRVGIGRGKSRTVYNDKAHAAGRTALASEFKKRLKGQRVAHNKVWLDIVVYLPNHRYDAVNFVDAVCDALKTVIPVDDKWYSIQNLDWQVDPENPRIVVNVGQESDKDVKWCAGGCNRVRPFGDFYINKHKKKDYLSSYCKECSRESKRRSKGVANARRK